MGGYFSLAFERFGFGKATYIDLDTQACQYVKNYSIYRIINDNVVNINEYTNEKFDFIYSRHLIEHLPNFIPIINKCHGVGHIGKGICKELNFSLIVE